MEGYLNPFFPKKKIDHMHQIEMLGHLTKPAYFWIFSYLDPSTMYLIVLYLSFIYPCFIHLKQACNKLEDIYIGVCPYILKFFQGDKKEEKVLKFFNLFGTKLHNTYCKISCYAFEFSLN